MPKKTTKQKNKNISQVIVEPILENITNPKLDGRDPKGLFTAGNQLSVGSHNMKAQSKAKQLKKALMAAISVEDMQKIVTKLVKQAKSGDVAATKELFDRCLGKPLQTHEIDVEVSTYTPDQCNSIRKMLSSRCIDSV